MSARMKPIIGAFVTAYIIFFLGTTYFFGPILANDAPGGALAPTWLSLGISGALLVDVFYLLNGTREMAAVYGMLAGGDSAAAQPATASEGY